MDLEVRCAFQEKLLGELDGVVRELRDELDALRAIVVQLQGQVALQPLEDAPPPHW